MQRVLRKVVTVTLLVSALVLTGCGGQGAKDGGADKAAKEVTTTKELFQELAAKTKKVESFSGAMKLAMDMTISGQNMKMGMDMAMAVINEPLAQKLDGVLSVEAAGQSQELDMEVYVVEEADQLVSYAKMNNEWTKSEQQKLTNTGFLSSDTYQAMTEEAAEYELAKESVEVNGKKCYRVEGKISGSSLTKMIDADMLDSMGNGIIDSDDWADLSFPFTMEVYQDSLLPASVKVDMAAAVSGLDSLASLDMEVAQYGIEMTFDEYDQVKEITVPQEGLDAA